MKRKGRARLWLAAAAWSVLANVVPSVEFPATDVALHVTTSSVPIGDRESLVRVLASRRADGDARSAIPLLVALVHPAGAAEDYVPDGEAWLDPTTGLLEVSTRYGASTCYEGIANSSGS